MPHVAGRIIRDALLHRLSRDETPLRSEAAGEQKENALMQSGRFYALLSASASLPESFDVDLRERELVESLIISHHPVICVCFAVINFYCLLTHPEHYRWCFTSCLDRVIPKGPSGPLSIDCEEHR